jgi:hypothetical protein
MTRRVIRLLFVVTLLSGPAEANDPSKGNLCVTGQPCRDSACEEAIEPAETSRPYTWTAAAGASYRLGVLESGRTSLPCSESGRIALRITAPKARRLSGALVTIVSASGPSWQLTLTERHLRDTISIALPRGEYGVTVESPRFVRKVTKAAVAAKAEKLTLDLQPLPALSGLVLARTTKAALAGAIVRAEGHEPAVADASGQFVLEIDPEAWPARVSVSALGYAESIVPVPAARAATVLDDIHLARAGSIRVEVPELIQHGDLEIELQRLDSGRVVGTPIHRRRIAAEGAPSPPATFEQLGSGRYVVLAKGSGPGERSGEVVELKEGEDQVVAIRITPIQLRIRTRMGGDPLPGAHVTLRNADHFWQAKFNTDAAGEAAVVLWQGGPKVATVGGSRLSFPYHDRRTIGGEREQEDWTIDAPVTTVEGLVIDAETGVPISQARVSLHATMREMAISVKAQSDAEGRFRFVPAPHGKHVLKAIAKGYLPAEMSYDFGEGEAGRALTMKLEAVSSATITVLDPGGVPISGARVAEFIGLRATNIYSRTDAGGVAQLPARKHETIAWVIPRDGSFGYARVRPGASEVAVRIAPPTSRIVLRAESGSGAPIANLSVVVRFNGQFLPPELVAEFERVQGARARSGADGMIVFDHMPSGVYEFWPGTTREVAQLAAGAGPRAPVRLVAAPGENVAVMTFVEAPGR